jgi:hypothetical protein
MPSRELTKSPFFTTKTGLMLILPPLFEEQQQLSDKHHKLIQKLIEQLLFT